MSSQLDELVKALFNRTIPGLWRRLAPDTLKSLGNWMIDFERRSEAPIFMFNWCLLIQAVYMAYAVVSHFPCTRVCVFNGSAGLMCEYMFDCATFRAARYSAFLHVSSIRRGERERIKPWMISTHRLVFAIDQ